MCEAGGNGIFGLPWLWSKGTDGIRFNDFNVSLIAARTLVLGFSIISLWISSSVSGGFSVALSGDLVRPFDGTIGSRLSASASVGSGSGSGSAGVSGTGDAGVGISAEDVSAAGSSGDSESVDADAFDASSVASFFFNGFCGRNNVISCVKIIAWWLVTFPFDNI